MECLKDDLKRVEPSEVTSLSEAHQFLSLLKKFRECVAETDKLRGDNYPQLLNSLLSVGEDGVYSNNIRFIFELIQNLDDCKFSNTEDYVLDIRFDFNNDKIVLRYNEMCFTPFNVFAITGIAEAAKNVSTDKNEIGEKGIGFKSVFGVADTVLIHSGWFSFELHKPNYFFSQTRVALCLECSKKFEAMRKRSLYEGNFFISQLKNTEIEDDGYIDVSIKKEQNIRFTATHLAEIQEILRSIPDLSKN